MAKTVTAASPDPDDDRRSADRQSSPPKEASSMSATPDELTPTQRRDDSGGPPPSAPAPASAPRPEPPDPFDPASLRLGADYSAGLGVRKVISTIPNRKPNKSEWFRVRPGEEWRLQTAVLELEKGVERSTYLVAQSLWPDLSGEISPAVLLTCVNRANDLFVWRVKLPGPDGRSNTWTDSALQIVGAAERSWCRMVSDTTNGIYTHYEPTTELPDPQWPTLSFNEIVRIAFRGRMIDSLDHPVIRELRGDA